MSRFLAFAFKHAQLSLPAALAAAFFGVGVYADATGEAVMGFKSWAWEAVAFAVFFVAVIALLYRWDEHHSPAAAATTSERKPMRWFFGRKTKALESRHHGIARPRQPPALTVEESQFLAEVRKLVVLLRSCDACFSDVIRAVLAWDFEKRASEPTREPLHHFFRAYVDAREPKIEEVVSLAKAADTNRGIQDLCIRIGQYLSNTYVDRQVAVATLNEALKQNISDYSQTTDWLSAERLCLDQWEAVKMADAGKAVITIDRRHFGCVGGSYRTGSIP